MFQVNFIVCLWYPYSCKGLLRMVHQNLFCWFMVWQEKHCDLLNSCIACFSLRFSRSNCIFLGLWFGYSKPDFLTFLQPFSKEFQDIYSKSTVYEHLYYNYALTFKNTSIVTYVSCTVSLSLKFPFIVIYGCIKGFSLMLFCIAVYLSKSLANVIQKKRHCFMSVSL